MAVKYKVRRNEMMGLPRRLSRWPRKGAPMQTGIEERPADSPLRWQAQAPGGRLSRRER